MKFQENKFYKHKYFVDVMFKVLSGSVDNDTEEKYTITWYLNKNKVPMRICDSIVIKNEDLDNYLEITGY